MRPIVSISCTKKRKKNVPFLVIRMKTTLNYPKRCKFMLQGECDFQGNEILSSVNIIDPEECLELSETFKGDYYYHDATTEMCKVYDNRSRNCNIQRSLRGAVTDGCQGEN